MGNTEKKNQPDSKDWKTLFEAVRIGIIVIGREGLKIKRYNQSAGEIFNDAVAKGSSIANISHELITKKLISGIRQIFKDSIPVNEFGVTKKSECFAIIVERWNSSAREEAILSFVDVTDLKDELEERINVEKQLQREILEVEEKERWRLGQYLHDSTAQNLMTIKMLMDLIEPQFQKLNDETNEELKKIKRLVIKSEKNIRELSHFVLPIEIEEKISEAFQELANQTEEIYDIKCKFTSTGDIDKLTDPALASSLYYISQEAIRNAIHHGQTENVNVCLSTDDQLLILTIKDDGSGYDESNQGNGMGINIMKHRAELLGGSLEIEEATEDGGTTVKCVIPHGQTKEKK